MKISLRHKIIAVNLTVLILAFAAVSFIVLERLDAVNINMLVENLKYQADLSVVSIRQSLLTGDTGSDIEKSFTAKSGEFAVKLSNEYKIGVEVFSSGKQRIAASGTSPDSTVEYRELDEVLKENRTYVIRSLQGNRYLFFCFPVVHQKVIGAVMFTYPLKEVDNMTRNTRVVLFVSFFIGLVVIVIVGMLLSVKITKPILALKESAVKISGGSFSEKIDISSSDETGELARAFNTMSSEIGNRMNMITVERTKLDSILKSMGEGVLALDGSNHILVINDIAYGLLTPALEVKIQRLSEKVRKNQVKTISEVESEGRILHLCGTPLKQDMQADGVVLILNDITELRLLQEKQKQFVTNVSHELKTPLTTILGYVDLLKQKGEKKEIFNTSLFHLQSAADRLVRLVNDLIDLSVLKKSEFEIEPRSTGMTALVGEIVSQMSLKAQKFSINLTARLPETSEINIDPVRVKQAFVNVLDNAIKYSCGETIRVELFEEKNKIKLVVSDNGCGIPGDLLEDIFEPFYRVDRARSRDMGGNGLGLAIAKEIIEKHNGTIGVESIEGKGTTVTMSLPKNTDR